MTKKEYEISVRANKKSIEQLKASLTTELNNAFENVDSAGKVKGLSRSDKAAIKADLSSLFGIADEQADALRKMVQGIIPSDTKSIDHMKSQLQDTLKFATGIMEQMKLLGDSTDWMKQGVSFVDKFVGMQGTLVETQKVVSGMQTSIDKLTTSFQTFKDALAITNNDAYLKRFSSEAKLAVDDVIKAQEILNKASKSRNQKVKTMAVASNTDVTDYTDMSADEIREEYASIIQVIKEGNAEIERLEAQFKGKKKELYDSEAYQRELRGLAMEVQNLQNLSKHPLFKDAFADAGTQITANLKAVTAEITNAAEKAGRELKEVIESLKGDGIEISVTLPDPDAAEFGSKISDFVTKASAQFKKKPIEISLDLSNPFKDAKKIKEGTKKHNDIKGLKEVVERHANETGVDVGDSLNGLDTTDTSQIIKNLLESFNKVYKAVKTGQATVTEATNQWRKEMQKALTLKASFDSTDAKAEVSAMMQELQNYLDENKPLYINTDTDELVQSIQHALSEAKFTVDVKAGNIDGSGVVSNVQIGQILNGLSNIQLVATDDGTSSTQQGKTPMQSKTASAVNKNSDAVEKSTHEQRVLTDEVKRLQNSINANTDANKMSEESNRRRTENIKQNSARIEDLQKNIETQKEKREEASNLRQKHIANRTEAEQEMETKRDSYAKRSGAIRKAIKDGDSAFVQQEFDTVIQDLNNEKKEMLAKLAAIDVNDPNNKKTATSYEKQIANIDDLLHSDKDKGQIVLDALYRAYQNQKQELETKIASIQYNIDRLTRNIESTWVGQDAAQAEIDKITQEAAVERSEMSIQTRQKESTKAQRRIDNINNVLQSGESPVTLVLDEVNKFWTQSSKTIERTEKEIAESTEALKKLNPDSKEYTELYQDIQKKQNKVDSWKKRQALMTQKGLTDMSEVGLAEAIHTLTEVLRKSPTLSDELLHSDGLKSLSAVKNIAYYSGVAQDALGFRTQTEQEYVDEKTLQAKFVELFRINEFLNKVSKLFPRGETVITTSDIKEFIALFEKVPELSKSIEPAKAYLAELDKIAAQDSEFSAFRESGVENKYFSNRMQSLWGDLDDTVKNAIGEVLSTKGVDTSNLYDAEEKDAIKIFSKMKEAYNEGLFGSIQTDNATFKQLTDLLKQKISVDSARDNLHASLKGITSSFEGKLKSTLFDALNTNEPISVKIVDGRGNEKVYDIHDQGRGTLNSDRSFSTNTKSLNQFLRISGLEKQMSEIVYAMFNDPDLAKTLIDNLFADGKVQLASKKNAFVPKSEQKYTFDESPLGQYIKNEEKNAKEREKLEAELVDLRAGKYSESLAKRLETMPAEKQTEAINGIIALKERQLAAIQRLDLTEDQIVQSLVALADDIEIAEAKVQKSQHGSRQGNKKAQRLLKDGTNSWDYQTAQRKAKKNTYDKDYNLTQLLSRIDAADQFGLMDTGVLVGLADDYLAKQQEARELTDLNKAGRVGKEQVDKAWDELRKARSALIEEYYRTEGWYLTNLAHSRMETAESEIRRMNKKASEDDIKQVLEVNDYRIANELKGKTDAQLMAEKYSTASANNSTDAQVEAAILAEKKKQLKSLMEKYGITIEMLDAERNLTRVSGESTNATRQTNDNISSSENSSTRTSGGTQAGVIGALTSANLATESTLRGIYELLNGGPPQGGWDAAGAMASGIKEELDLSVHSFSGVLDNLASSIGQFAKNVSAQPYENMAFFDDTKNVGKYLEGKENVVDANIIKDFLNQHANDGLKLALHSHPDGMSALTPADIESAIALSSTYGVGASGAVTAEKITGVDFSGVSKEIGLAILGTYKDNIRKSSFAEIFDDNFEIKPEYANSPSLDKHQLSNELNKFLRDAITAVGLNADDIFGQVDVSQLDSAAKKVADTVIQNGVQAVEKTVQSTNPNAQNLQASGQLASGIKDIMTEARNSTVNVGYLIDRFGKFGDTLKGSKYRNPFGTVPKSDYEEDPSLGLIAMLHRNVGNDQNPFASEYFYNSVYQAYDSTQKIPISGSINDDGIVAIDWSGIDSEVATQIRARYRELMHGWIYDESGLFTWNDQTKEYDSNADKINIDEEFRKLIYQKYNEISQQALSEFGYADRFKQFGNSDDFANYIARYAPQQATETIVETGTQVVAETSQKESQATSPEQERVAVEQAITQEMQKQSQLATETAQKESQVTAAEQEQVMAEQVITQEMQQQAQLVGVVSSQEQVVDNIVTSSAKADVEVTKEVTYPVVATNNKNNGKFARSGLDIARNYYSSLNLSDKQVEHNADKLVNYALQYAFGQDPNGTNKFYFMGSKEDANKLDLDYYIKKYKAIDNVLQLIGYHLDKLQPNMIDSKNQWGFSAKVVANSNHVVTNLEEAREILFGLRNNQPDEIVGTTKTSIPSLENFDAATTKELAQYIGSNFKKDNGKNISGSRPLSAAMYELSRLDIFAEGFVPTDVNSEQLAKAWSQLQIGVEQEVAKQLNDDIKAYIQLLQLKLQEIADANGLDYNTINSAVDARKKAAQDISGTSLTKESVEEARKYLNSFTKTSKNGKVVKQTGVERAQKGLKNVYSVLSNGRDKLTNDNLRDLGTGYYQLVETVNHEIFSKFNEQTQQMLIQARDTALATLEQYGVKVYGSSDLQNQVISEDTKSLISGGKVGHKFGSMTAPALVRTTTDADGNTEDKILQKAQGRVIAEKAVTEEKKKQKKLTQENAQQETKTSQEVQERATAEQQVNANKKKSQTSKTSSGGFGVIPPSSNIKVPESGNNQGGILGLLGQIAKEETLKSIASILSKGIKTTSGGEGSGKSSKKTDAVLSDSEALSKLQEKIRADYPEFASVSNSRAVSGGHTIDVFQYKNLDKIKEARAEIERLNNEGKAGTEEWNVAQQHLNALLSEQEKITLKINTTTGEITTKSSFQNLAVGAKAASQELQRVDAMMSQLQEVGILSFGANGEITSSNQAVQNYLNSLRQLQIYKDGLSQDTLFDPSTQQQLSNLTLTTQNYRKEVVALLNDTSRLNSGTRIGQLTSGIVGLDDVAIKKSMQDIVSQGTQLEATFGELTPVTNEFGQVVSYQLGYTLKTGKREVQDMTAVLNPLTGELMAQKGTVKEVATGWDKFLGGLKGKFASITQYILSMGSIHRVWGTIRQGVQYVREIDSALTELKKVTDGTSASYKKFAKDMSQTGSVIGATTSNLITMASEWARLGYSMEDAGKLAKSTAILLNVSEFQDATAASEALISTMQAFGYAADESMHVVDVLNEVGEFIARR